MEPIKENLERLNVRIQSQEFLESNEDEIASLDDLDFKQLYDSIQGKDDNTIRDGIETLRKRLIDSVNQSVDSLKAGTLENPTNEKKKIKHRIKFALTKIQRQELLQIAEDSNETHYVMMATQALCGLRAKEVVNLLITDIDLTNNQLWVRNHDADPNCTPKVKAFKCKTEGSNNILPIPANLAKILKRFIKNLNRKKGYVFVSRKNGPFGVTSYIDLINDYASQCKSIPNKTIGSHILRVTYASYLYSNNIEIGIISKLLRHKSLKTTIGYLAEIFDMNRYENVVNILDSLI